MKFKAIIPAAGFGTRMLPAAKAVPKELLPVLDRPAVQYVVEEAAAAGVEDLLLVTSRHKRAIEDHFDRDGEMEARLKQSGREHLLASLNALAAKIRIQSVRQARMRGLGDAVAQGRTFCGDQPFLCMLGDAIFSGRFLPAAQLIEAHGRFPTALIGVEEVPLEKVDRYGIVAGDMVAPGILRVRSVVEKPALAAAPSRWAIAARYLLTPAIFDCLDQTPPGAGGEVQLTDALAKLLERQPVHAVVLGARRHDIGDLGDWLSTNLIFAAADRNLWRRIEPLLGALLK